MSGVWTLNKMLDSPSQGMTVPPYAFCIERPPETIAALGRRALAGQFLSFGRAIK